MTARLAEGEWLTRAGERRHMVQFYEEERFLVDSVSDYLLAGLKAGEPLLIVARPEHIEAFVRRLEERGAPMRELRDSGRFVARDAFDVLARLMEAELPSAARFREIVGGEIQHLLSRAPGSQVRAYGEMVDVLWKEGKAAAATRLEVLWNELSTQHPFVLLCAYDLASFAHAADAVPFREICDAHAPVLPSERYSATEREEARLLEVTLLQQKALALETEIARRKRVEVALREALQARDDFLCLAGHELRTPLTAIKLQLQSLNGRHREGALAPERFQRLNKPVARLSSLVEELLDVARMGGGQLELVRRRFDLRALVHEVLERNVEGALVAHCPVELHVDAAVWGVWDRERLDQVVSSLVGNALKYGAGRPVELWLAGTPDRARLQVKDGGIGVPLEDQSRIFGRFERAVSGRNFGGLGLGLWISREIVEAHGGTIRIESEPGQGATFVVELPLLPPELAPPGA